MPQVDFRSYRNINGESYSTGNPYINLCLAILKDAKKDKGQLWVNFQGSYDYKGSHPIPLDVALWVGGWLEENRRNVLRGRLI